MTEHTAGSAVIDVEALRAAVASLVGDDPATLVDHENLIERGLDSIGLMRLAGQWRRAGIEVSFAELAERPTLASWFELLASRGSLDAEPSPGPGPGVDSAPAPVAEPAGEDDDGAFDLALMQHAYWIGRDPGQRLGGVAAHLYTEFDGHGVEPARLERAVRALVTRHELLRVAVGDDGRQRVVPAARWSEERASVLTVHDLRHDAEADIAAALDRRRDALSHQLLDIGAATVFDLQLSLLPEGRTRLHVDVDMVAADALSYRLLLGELATLYDDPDCTLPPIGYDYRSYLSRRAEVRAEPKERARRWWHERLDLLPGAPTLPTVPEREMGAAATRVIRRHHWLDPERRARLTARARVHRVTPVIAVAAAFAETLGAWSADPTFLLNVPLFGREPLHPDVDRLVGDFTGSVLLAADVSGEVPFADRARRLQARLHTDAVHADYSGVEVLRDLGRHTGEPVLAPVVFTSALNLGELFGPAVRSRFGDAVWIISQGPQVLLDAQVTELDGGLLVNWDAREAAFPSGVVDAMFSAFCTLLDWLLGDEPAWDKPVPALVPAAQRAVRAAANDTEGRLPTRPLHAGFFTAAQHRPDAPALLWGAGGRRSYGEVAADALAIGAALRRGGVRRGDPVGVLLPKGPDQVAAVLGVLAAGAAYVPISTDQPPSRRDRIVARAGLGVVVAETADAVPGMTCLAFDAACRHQPALESPVPVKPDDTAYILFTSGSTGEPKGVAVPHGAAMSTIEDLDQRLELGPGDRCLAVSALDFDLSVFDLFALLGAGGAVVLVGETDRREASAWLELAVDHEVTVLNCAPPLLDMVLGAADLTGTELADFRAVLLGGDWVTLDLPARLAKVAPTCRFLALGGTTETAIHSTLCEVVDPTGLPAGWHAVPYGRPLRNVACRVVDQRGRDCPDWVPGELWIGGAGVADGYVGDPVRTADRFVGRDGRRWYRTGDQARYWPDGTLDFLGRRDRQVKVRGFRIELGEVEAALASHPSVRRALAVVAGGEGSDATARHLVAAVAAPGATEEEILAHAAVLLPPQMLPGQVLVLDELPLTANGKLDRAAVVARAGTPLERSYDPPRTAVESVVAGVWSEVLGRDGGGPAGIGRDDDFFTLGGDSVLATAVVIRLRQALATGAVSVRALFSARTVAGLAARLVAEEENPGRLEQVAALSLEIDAMSADEVDAQLGSAPA